jgi:hypothetical protein
VRLSIALLLASALGMVGGAWLIGRWAVGCAVIFDSLALGAWALWGYDDGQPAVPPQVLEASPAPGVWSVPDILERARAAP